MKSRNALAARLALVTLAAGAAANCAHAQAAARSRHIDLAATATFEQARATADTNFWLKGAAFSGACTFYKGFGVAANASLMKASEIAPGVGLSKMTFVAGPRYTLALPASSRRVRVFGETLFGGTHAFNTILPKNGVLQYSGGSFAMQLGGGVDVAIKHSFGLRLIEVDHVRTALPNGTDDTQKNLRLSFGVTWSR